ncbi:MULTISPECIES: hypothetical protein [Okeania]|nr:MULTISPECIES: hypothetical protein [unclassified Okeania]
MLRKLGYFLGVNPPLAPPPPVEGDSVGPNHIKSGSIGVIR